MEKVWTIVAIIGSVSSVVGAYISCMQAKNSKNSASKAERIRSQLIDHHEAKELYQLQASCKKAQNAMAKYGVVSTKEVVAGVDKQKDAFIVQELIDTIREHREYFMNETNNEADEFCDILLPLLEVFVKSSNFKQQQNHGKEIVSHLSILAAKIKNLLDLKIKSVY